jgi:hypothetical protein
MSHEAFEEVSGFDPLKALKLGKAPRLNESDEGSTSVTAAERVYIVFSEKTSIQEGISLIENTVLQGGRLVVSRVDETGHAIVAILSPLERRALRSLGEVERVKVERAAHIN